MAAGKRVFFGGGLSFFIAIAVLAGMMGLALGPTHPLMVFWLAAPLPFVFAWLVLRGPGSRPVRVAAKTYLVVASGVTLLSWGVGWMVSEQLRTGGLAPERSVPKYDLEVVAVGSDTLTLRATDQAKESGAWAAGGLWGLEGADAYYQVSSRDRQGVDTTWTFTRLKGDLKAGDRVRLSSRIWPDDSVRTFAVPVQKVAYTSPMGEFRAWKTGGSGDTWAVFVHGKGGEALQDLRVAPMFSELGLPVLLITYRNDEGAPASPDGFYRYGQTEWEDLEGAVQYALDNGAKRVVLAGWSMGGAIAAKFLYTSPLAGNVVAVVLDSPMMDFGATVDYGARGRGIPRPIVLAGKAVSRYRFGVDWSALDYVEDVAELSTPVLLIHGDADETVPIETSDAVARRAAPGTVRYETFPSAPHIASWNVDRERYEATLRAFLLEVLR